MHTKKRSINLELVDKANHRLRMYNLKSRLRNFALFLAVAIVLTWLVLGVF